MTDETEAERTGGLDAVRDILEPPVQQPGRIWTSEPVKKSSRAGVIARRSLLTLSIGALLGGSSYAIYQGIQPKTLDAPLPVEASAGADVALVGADGQAGVDVDDLDDGNDPRGDELTDGSDDGDTASAGRSGRMKVESMGANSLFMPAIGAYAPLVSVTNFTKNPAHSGWSTILLPRNPRKAAWYSATPLVGGDQGTTVIAGHVSYRGQWGSLRKIAKLTPGNTLWTKDSSGKVQRWKVTQVFARKQTDFPQMYWNTQGPRQLVLVTCGGPFVNRHYRDNVFAVAIPVQDNGDPLATPSVTPSPSASASR